MTKSEDMHIHGLHAASLLEDAAERDGHDCHGCVDVEGYTHFSGLSGTELAGVLTGSTCTYASLAYHYTPRSLQMLVRIGPWHVAGVRVLMRVVVIGSLDGIQMSRFSRAVNVQPQ